MSILNKQLKDFSQNFDVNKTNKLKYGEVRTDFKLIKQMFDLLPNELLEDPNLKWCDPCCGNGYFSIYLYFQLLKFQKINTKKTSLKKKHDIINQITMVEINNEHHKVLKETFGEKSNILQKDFLTYNEKFDIIIGNPPFNCDGLKKVPTQKQISKKKDGKNAWIPFLKHSVNQLNDGGYLLFITPSIWMKNDHSCFDWMKKYKIHKLHTMTNTETNKIFHKQAQTPTCFFLLQKIESKGWWDNYISIYDKYLSTYTKHYYTNKSIPLCGISIINKLQPYVKRFNSLNVIKTSIRPSYKSFKLSDEKTKEFSFPNISTCRLNKLQPELVIKYSNKELKYKNQTKLVLAHKMYGFPYLDKGEMGICNRDNYVILGKEKNLLRLQQFLSTTFCLFLFETTRYRMKYLERYIFELIPNICNIYDFPETINDQTIMDYFKLTEAERKMITNFFKKKYEKFN